MVNKEIIKKLAENKDEIRGVDFKTDEEFILKEKGKGGLERIEREMAKLGYPIKYKEMNTMFFYPIGLRVLSLLVIEETFNFDEEKIEEMGREACKSSLLIRLLTKFFVTLPRMKKEASKTWRRYHTTGELRMITPKIDFAILKLPGHSCIFRLTGHKVHPVYCSYLKGYFSKVVEMATKVSPVTCEETKCPFKGDKYHEYLLKW